MALLAIAPMTGCSGSVEPVATESRPNNASRDGGVRDAGRKRDARAEEEEETPSDDEATDDEIVEEPVLPPASTRDAGPTRDAQIDAGKPDTGAPATPDAGPPPAAGCGADGPFAKGLKLRELAAYQTVKVPLYKDGAWVTTSTVPVVAGKKTLLRVFVDTMTGYARHNVRATLTLKGAAGETTLQNERSIAASSTDADEASTFAFEIEPAKLAADTQIAVALEEIDCAAAGGQASDARLPATGTRELGADAIGKLKVVLLPISIGGLLPTVDDAEIAKIRAALLAYFPVGTVDVSVRSSAATGPSALTGADSNGWSNVLNTVMRERASDAAASDVYYFGLVKPASTFAAFCARGCILGIAPQTTRVSPSAQAGLGAYFQDAQSIETIVHELGHAHGRGHAPCAKGGQIQGVDGSFPERAGGIMEWGWDSRTSKLISPTTHKDVMGYCSPNWISPYTYGALATRSLAVNKLAFVKGAESATPWRNVLLYADGSARWGGAVETRMPGGEIESATVLDASGATIANIEVTRLELSHTDDIILYLPSPGADWASVVLRDRTLALRSIQPAL
ncbi:MAG: M66 family metalloprotease [Polyangiales bacterium]